MILADTSIWIDHLRAGDANLATQLATDGIVRHPLIVAEIALGSLKERVEVLGLLDNLPALPVAQVEDVRFLVEERRLFGRGIGYVDCALIASCLMVPGTSLWTRDRRLRAVAADLGIAHTPATT